MWRFLHCGPVLIPGLSIIPGLSRPQVTSRSFPTESLSSSVLLSCPSGHIYGLRCGGADPWASSANGRDTSPQELVIALPWDTSKLTSGWHHISQHWLPTKVTVLLYFGFITCSHNRKDYFFTWKGWKPSPLAPFNLCRDLKGFLPEDTSPQTTSGLTFVVSPFSCGFWRCCRSCRAGKAMELGGGSHGACACRLC